MSSYLYALFIYPLEMFIEAVFSISMNMIPSAGYAIIFVSIAVQLLVLPIYKRADELQDEERSRQKKMARVVKHIKETFKGEERVMMLSTYYREEHYHQYYQLQAVLPLILQIPFFIAAYHFLSNCDALNGASFYFLSDMGKPDGMIAVGNISINIMPIAMTVINILSGIIYTKGLDLKDKLQLYVTAGVFLVLLYDSPSGLVFYWTLNNVFSLLKNIFMKLVKHAREVISVSAMVFVMGYCYKCFQRGLFETLSGKIVMITVFVMGFIPVINLIRDKLHVGSGDDKGDLPSRDENMLFRVATISEAAVMGLMIPVVTISSSPTEFVIRGHYVTPLVQVIYSIVVGIGIFVIWGNLIYGFCPSGTRKLLCCGMFVALISGLVNYQFFRWHLDNMSKYMTYKLDNSYTGKEMLINAVVLVCVMIAAYLLYRYNKRASLMVEYALLATVVMMSAYSIYKINDVLDNTAQIKDDEYYTNSKVSFELDKSGRNVVLIMLDRAFGPYLPYIMHEKPELADAYSGFTYYPNTISHGTRTRVGAPALFGGYEYTAYAVKDSDRWWGQQHEALKVLPKLFRENGYECTVLDPPYYLDTGGQTLEEWYHAIDPGINAYYADGVIKTPDEALRDFNLFEKYARSNYIRHSVYITSPLVLRDFLYDNGSYLTQRKPDFSSEFAGHLAELNSLPDMTDISDSGTDTFTIIENDATHDPTELQMPDYTLADQVDNTDYLDKWRGILNETPGGRKINMYGELQISSYGSNLATLESIGRWIEYLKSNDLYDNTRIVIVADHGFNYMAFDDMILDKGGASTDLCSFTPLLMVKDFGDGDFDTSDEFMTNADVPTIIMDGLIKNPVNPYTGNPINNDKKFEDVQYCFDDARWVTVHDNIYDIVNWDVPDVDFSNKELIPNTN